MPNSGNATATITSTTGPGQAVTAGVFTGVKNFSVNFGANTMRVDWDGGITYLDYSAMATFTWTISGGRTTLTISS